MCSKNLLKINRITDITDLDFMQNVQDFFAKTMNISLQSFYYNTPITQPSNFTDFCSKYTMISEKGLARCTKCLEDSCEKMNRTKKTYIADCHAGLKYFSIPLFIDNKYLATVYGGKILTEAPDETHFRKIAKEIGINEDSYWEECKKIRILSEEKFNAIVQSLESIIKSIASIAYAKCVLANAGLEYKFSKSLALEHWLILNCEENGYPITPREFEVLKRVVQGKSNTKIAKELFISVHTVKAHVSSVLEKLGVEDRVQVAVKAIREGLVD